MWFGRSIVIDFLVPAVAVGFFLPAWAVSAIFQPINSIAFLTDGAHWGTGDYRYLRDAMITATIVGITSVSLVNLDNPRSLTWIWIATGGWAATRAVFGLLRVWPGIGESIFKDA